MEQDTEWLNEREEAVAYEKSIAEWTPIFDDYIDPFCAEIFLAFRNGTLRAFGTSLAGGQSWDEANLDELDSAPVVEIPPGAWISDGIDWKASALKTRDSHFIWVHVLTADMTIVFPPTLLIKPGILQAIGEDFAISTSDLSGHASKPSRRGRPPLPWDQFHVEVARLFCDGQMPEKKEAAIAMLQDWFEKSTGRKAGRTAVGDKLKPYFDKLVQKTENRLGRDFRRTDHDICPAFARFSLVKAIKFPCMPALSVGSMQVHSD